MPEPMPKRGVADSQLRNWARGERRTPPPPEAVAELLAENDELRARERAARPVLDAAEKWAEFNGSTNELLAALDAYRAALGSAEAGAVSANEHAHGEHVSDHADDGHAEVGAPAAEPAPDREQAPHFMHTQDVIEDALVGAGYQDLPDLADIVFVATEAARDALGVCQTCGDGQPGMYPSDPDADGYAGPEECSACDGTGWARALAGAGAPEPAQDDEAGATP